MKAIIIAAGLGSRLGEITSNKPKCMIDIAGKPLLQRQVDILHQFGIHDISVVVGYMKDKVTIEGVKYFINDNYSNNNILNSLFYAESEIHGEVLILYCDIIFSEKVLKQALENTASISVVTDADWRKAYEGRLDHPISEAESVIYDKNNTVMAIGKIIDGIGPDKENVPGEFIGMFKLNNEGAALFKKEFHLARKNYTNKPFQKAKIFEKAYITDMMQEIVDNGYKVSATLIKGGWREIDTKEDYQNAQELIKNKSL